MRGEEGGRWLGSSIQYPDRFTVGCLGAQRDRRAMDFHQQIPARLACTDIDGSVR